MTVGVIDGVGVFEGVIDGVGGFDGVTDGEGTGPQSKIWNV